MATCIESHSVRGLRFLIGRSSQNSFRVDSDLLPELKRAVVLGSGGTLKRRILNNILYFSNRKKFRSSRPVSGLRSASESRPCATFPIRSCRPMAKRKKPGNAVQDITGTFRGAKGLQSSSMSWITSQLSLTTSLISCLLFSETGASCSSEPGSVSVPLPGSLLVRVPSP